MAPFGVNKAPKQKRSSIYGRAFFSSSGQPTFREVSDSATPKEPDRHGSGGEQMREKERQPGRTPASEQL